MPRVWLYKIASKFYALSTLPQACYGVASVHWQLAAVDHGRATRAAYFSLDKHPLQTLILDRTAVLGAGKLHSTSAIRIQCGAERNRSLPRCLLDPTAVAGAAAAETVQEPGQAQPWRWQWGTPRRALPKHARTRTAINSAPGCMAPAVSMQRNYEHCGSSPLPAAQRCTPQPARWQHRSPLQWRQRSLNSVQQA